ncbi:MAG: hypothetical protein KF909_12660, partial [Rhodocyclaceae bacterium]|nr:hypothetical protein [Rhodocyclaceae bacterium]
CVDMVENDLGIEALGMLEESFHQLGSHHPIGVGGPVVDVRGGHQLATLCEAGDQDWLEIRAGGVYGGRITGWAGSEYEQAYVAVLHGDADSWQG